MVRSRSPVPWIGPEASSWSAVTAEIVAAMSFRLSSRRVAVTSSTSTTAGSGSGLAVWANADVVEPDAGFDQQLWQRLSKALG